MALLDLKSTQKEYPNRKYRQRHRNELSADERTEVVHSVLVGKVDHETVARTHRISKTLVSNLARLAKANPKYFEEL
jgi:hypothetical protein